jgi:hypothetical protein
VAIMARGGQWVVVAMVRVRVVAAVAKEGENNLPLGSH